MLPWRQMGEEEQGRARAPGHTRGAQQPRQAQASRQRVLHAHGPDAVSIAEPHDIPRRCAPLTDKESEVHAGTAGARDGRGEGREPGGSRQRTRGDPCMQAQSLHQSVVQEHSHQRHQDVGEAHVKHNRGPWWGGGNRRSGEPHPLHLPPPGTASSLCPKGADSPERVSGCPWGHTAIHSRARV